MNNLSFIDKLISDIDTAIRLRKIDAKVYEALDDTEEIESNQYALKQLEDYIQHFKQIKNEIEAWEIVAPALIEGKLVGLSYFLKHDIEKFNIIKKVLENKND